MRLERWLSRWRSRAATFKVAGEYDVYEAMARQRRKVLAGEKLAVQRVLGAYKVARDRIDSRLDAITKKLAQAQAAGEPISPAWLYQQARWQTFLAEIDAAIVEFSSSAQGIVHQNAQAQAAAGGASAQELAVAAGITGGFTMMGHTALLESVGLLSTKSPLFDLFQTMSPNAVQAARKAFAEGIAEGANPKVIARRLRQEIASLTGHRAVLIARTEHMRAYTAAQQATYEANSDVVMASRIMSARDGRTCPLCLAQDGRILQHGEPFARHPGCRCALAPVPRFSGLTNHTTGEEWLQTQPESVQKAALGPGRYALWKAGVVSLPDLVQEVDHPRWGRGLKLRTLNDLGKDIAAGSTQKQFLTKAPGVGVITATAGMLPDLLQPASTPTAGVATSAPRAKVWTAAELAQTNPAPASSKTTSTSYTKSLIGKVGDQLSLEQTAALVQHHFPKAKITLQGVADHYASLGKTPSGGFPSGYVHTPKAPPIAKPKPIAGVPPPIKGQDFDAYLQSTVAAAPQASAAAIKGHLAAWFPSEVADTSLKKGWAAAISAARSAAKSAQPAPDASAFFLHTADGGQAGSNPGGFYIGQDGVRRYVKFYNEASQAYCEHLANEVYRDLGLEAPQSVLFNHQGKVAYASVILESEGTLGSAGITQARARAVLDGIAADILLANWDAVGMSHDNVVILKGGGVARIDQGGTLLYRAKAGRKPAPVLDDIPEWAGLFDPSKNPAYHSVATKAGYWAAEEMGLALKAQIKRISDLRAKHGGWDSYVRAKTPGMDASDQARIVQMLEARTALLEARAAQLKKAKKPKAPAPWNGQPIDPATTVFTPLTVPQADAVKRRDYASRWTSFTKAKLAALASYKGSGYRSINREMRNGPPSSRYAKDLVKFFHDDASRLQEDVILYRACTVPAWGTLDASRVGDLLPDLGFISTSSERKFSASWSGNLLLEVRVARGTKYLPANNPTYSDYEHEFIFHGMQIRVIGVQYDPAVGKTVVQCEMVETYEGEATWQQKMK